MLLCLGTGRAQAAAWWTPPQRLTWYWQLDGTPPAEPVQAVDVDGFDASAATVAALHARGQRAICYIDAGTYEPGRGDDASFPSSVLGSGVSGWPGEKWLDVSQLGVLEPIMAKRFAMCAQKGFDAVEPDNIDGYSNSTGFALTAGQQLAYDEWIAGEVHALGMAVFQKNDPDQAAQLQPSFDGALDEECNAYDECSAFRAYLAAGKPVLNAEYTDDGETTAKFCAADQAAGIMGALYSVNLDGSLYQPCFGPSTLSGPIKGGPFSGTGGTGAPGGTGGTGGTGGAGTGGSTGAGGTSGRSGTSGGGTKSSGTKRHRSGKVDGKPPRVRLVARAVHPTRRVLTLSLGCPARQSYCAGTLRVTTAPLARAARVRRGRSHQVALSTRRFHIRGGHVARLRLRLRARALRRLSHRRSLTILVTVDARDRRGRRARTVRRLTLTRPRGR